MQTVSGRAPEGVWELPHTRLPAPTPAPASAAAATPAHEEPTPTALEALPEGFADARSTPAQLVQLVFGGFSVAKRYQHSSSRDCYFQRGTDNQLAQALSEQRWVLLEGHPLAGKTRAAFEALRQLLATQADCVLWAYRPAAASAPGLAPLPAFPAHARLRVVWFDDFDQILHDMKALGYHVAQINQYLATLAEAGYVLLASARTGPQNYSLQRRFGLNDHLWDKLEIVTIPRRGRKRRILAHGTSNNLPQICRIHLIITPVRCFWICTPCKSVGTKWMGWQNKPSKTASKYRQHLRGNYCRRFTCFICYRRSKWGVCLRLPR